MDVSKLANVFFTFELHKRLSAAGFDTMANVSNSGLVLGNLQANSVELTGVTFEFSRQELSYIN